MWKPGKWVYMEEEEEEQQSSIVPSPPSPPWKLGGQVPEETSIFKNGRRTSKRFETLNQSKLVTSNSSDSRRKKKSIQSSSLPISTSRLPATSASNSILDSNSNSTSNPNPCADSSSKTDSNPESKTDPNSKSKADLGSTSIADSDSTSKKDSDVASKKDSDVTSKKDSDVTSKIDLNSRPNTDLDLKSKTDPISKPTTDSTSKSKTDSNLKPKTDSHLKSKTDSHLKSKTDPISKPKADSQLKPKTDSHLKSKTDPISKPKADSQLKPKTDSHLKPKTDTNLKSKTDSHLKSKTDTNLKSKTDTNLKPKTDTNLKPKTDSNLKPKTDSNVKPQTDSTVKPQTDSNLNSNSAIESQNDDKNIKKNVENLILINPSKSQSVNSDPSNPQKSLEPISPKTCPVSPKPTNTVITQLIESLKTASSLTNTINTATTTISNNNEEPPHSIVDTNSVTECRSGEPPTPSSAYFSTSSSVPIRRRFSAPPLAICPLQNPPLKKFKPWEALKGIQTDGAEVAGDLKLIQEAHLRLQKKVETSARQQQLQYQNKSGSASSKPQRSDIGSLNPEDSTATDSKSLVKFDVHESIQNEPTSSFGQSRHSSSSELTELSSNLSDLPEEPISAQRSASPSMIYSESDLEDDCLPDVLIRKVKRPSFSTAPNQKSQKEILKWKRRKSALLQHKERKAALRSLANQNLNENPSTLPSECFQPPPYIKIKANVYPYRKPEISELPHAVCNCTDGGCGETCLNRAMFYLCDPKSCKLGQSCTNQPFNLRKDLIDESSSKLGKGLKVFYTGPVKGWGLKTEIKLKKDIFLIDYRGEIISRDVCYKRVLNDYNGCQHFYLMDYDGSDVIDAGKKGNCARFINHSCSPNLRVERFKLSGLEEYQFGIFTLRDIEVGEELSYDYGWRNFSDIAPTSNVRTTVRSKLSKKKNGKVEAVGMRDEEEQVEEEEEEEEEEEGGEDQNSSRRSKRRTKVVSTEVVRATAPTVQRCSCETKGCKGFLGAKKLLIPTSKVNKKPKAIRSHTTDEKSNRNLNTSSKKNPSQLSNSAARDVTLNPSLNPSNAKVLPLKRKRK